MAHDLAQAVAESQLGDRVLHITGVAGDTTLLEPHQNHVKVTPSAGAGVHTVTLPPVAQCKWRIFVVETPTDATGTVTVNTRDDDDPVMGDVSLTATDDILVVLSIGSRWVVLLDVST